MSDALFDTTRDLDAALCRNIVSLRTTVDLFDDLTEGDAQRSAVAAQAEMRVKALLPSGVVARGFHYTTAIEYPFVTEPYLRSRYGDGTHGVWYGALDAETTIFETAYHMIQDEGRIAGLDEEVQRERAVYDVRCLAILIDLSAKRVSHPHLIEEDSAQTHAIAQRLIREGHPGLLAPSARCAGTTAAIFNIAVLSDPRLKYYLTYRYAPRTQTVLVEREVGKPLYRLIQQGGILQADRF